MSIEAMKQALEALEVIGASRSTDDFQTVATNARYALRQAIEQAEKQAALDKMSDNARELGLDYDPVACFEPQWADPVTPLYTAPPQAEKQEPEEFVRWSKEKEFFESCQTPRKEWVGLTHNEIFSLMKQFPDHLTFNIALAIEAKLKERNA